MQELGETRDAMTRALMKRVEKIINDTKVDEYYILVHGKPFPHDPKMIKMKYLIMDRKPSMMLSCMLFHVDNKQGILKLCWCLAGDWPKREVGSTGDPIPEVIASFDRLEKKLKYRPGTEFFESREEEEILATP